MREHSDSIPKPMVTVGDRPILWHIMRYYAHFGHREFVLCLGFRADVIRDYFLHHGEESSADWHISFEDTGLEASVGERLKAVGRHLSDDDIFLANYGDVLTDAPLPGLIKSFQRSHKLAAFLAVRPTPYTFHLVRFDGRHRVRDVQDVSRADLWLNGGYFMFRREVLDAIGPGEDLVPDVIPRLIERDQVLGYRHDGFWAPMDTVRDWQNLERHVESGHMPWAVWQGPPSDGSAREPEAIAPGVDGAA